MHEDFCMVSDFPEFIHTDSRNRAHCLTWPSHRWRDWFSIFSINGIQIEDEELYWKIVRDELTVAELLAIENNDTRAIAYEYFNKEKFASEPHKILDEAIDDKGNPMKIVEFKNENIGRFYVWICPNTWKTHYLATKEDECIRAKEASFWLEDVEWIAEY